MQLHKNPNTPRQLNLFLSHTETATQSRGGIHLRVERKKRPPTSTSITGLSGMTHSSRVFSLSDLPTQPTNIKGKAKIVEEQNDKTTPTPNEDIPVKGLSEKRDGCGKKEVSLE